MPKSPLKTKEKEKEKEAEEKQRLRIRVRAYDHKILDSSVKQIVDTALRYGSEIHGPVPLPTEIKKYTVNRSSFVHKNPTAKVVEAMTNLNLPAGVDIEIKM